MAESVEGPKCDSSSSTWPVTGKAAIDAFLIAETHIFQAAGTYTPAGRIKNAAFLGENLGLFMVLDRHETFETVS